MIIFIFLGEIYFDFRTNIMQDICEQNKSTVISIFKCRNIRHNNEKFLLNTVKIINSKL